MWPFQARYTVELEELKSSYDYIIVGAGSAGCVLANRLSQDPSVSVLVLERGGPGSGWKARVPLLSSDFHLDSSRSRIFRSVPQPALGNKPTEIVVGNTFGGTSKVNGMIYTRGLPSQFNAWSLEGRKGWSYQDLYPFFLKSEGALNKTEKEEYHNLKGEWKNRSTPQCFFAAAHHSIEAAKDLNFPYITDLNSPHAPIYGIAKLDHNIDENGRRSDAASVFLPDSLLSTLQDRLHVCVNALVTRLDLETSKNGTLIAKGVVIEHMDDSRSRSQEISISATKEVILCAGALGTPHILMLSGIGPRQHLTDIGIKVQKDLSGVGENLQDHMGVSASFIVPLKDSIEELQKHPLAAVRELARYLLFGTGAFLCPVHELSLFVKGEFLSENSSLAHNLTSTDQDDPKYLPDIEMMTIAFGDTDKADKSNGGFSLLIALVRPFSRGTVRLNSKDPRENPIVDPNLLGDPRDRIIAHKGIKLCLKLKEQMAANGYFIQDYKVPKDTSPSELDRHIVETGQSIYHYSSTCRMAPEDDSLPGVVDDELRVHGVKNLRIVDASVFPSIPSTHLQATVIAMAEKCSEMLKQNV